MKYSILVTAYDPDNRLTEMTKSCLDSIKECSEGEDYELLLDTGPVGLFGAYNRLFSRAQGDYFVVVPNDTVIFSKDWLNLLAIPGKITSWHIGTFLLTGHQEPDGGVTCYPRDIVMKIGPYDERFDDGYGFGDNDYFYRARQLGVEYEQVPVKLKHNGNTTYMTYWPEKKKEMYDRCLNLFKTKWDIK